MNRVLARQLRRLGLSPDELPKDRDTWASLLACVGASYDDVNQNRDLSEGPPEASAPEKHDFSEDTKTRRELGHAHQLSRHNFLELPVAAWLEDFRGVVDRLDDLRASGVEDLEEYLDAHPEALSDLIERVEVLDCNHAVSELIGVDREELLGNVDVSAMGVESLESWRQQFEAIWVGMGRVEVEFTAQQFDQTKFPAILHWSVAEIDGSYDFSRVMVVVIDITDRIAAEEKMRRLVVAKDEFLASVSHELRSPLTAVLGYAEILMEDDIDPEERRLMLSTIADQAADLSELVEDLLAGARDEVGRLDIESIPIDIGVIVDGCLRSFPEVERIGEIGEHLFAIADGARVRQILRNLLTNAQRYGGRRIAVRPMTADEHAVEISVCDSGPPVEAGLTGRVFERYFREQSAESRPESVGIGLTISRDLARRMGGDLSYRHDGKWSEFVLTLPRATRHLRAVG